MRLFFVKKITELRIAFIWHGINAHMKSFEFILRKCGSVELIKINAATVNIITIGK